MKTNTSKHKMKAGLFNLLASQMISEITVKELCKVTGLHRSTFYDNYGTIYDLYRELHFDAFRSILEKTGRPDANHPATAQQLLDAISIYEENDKLRFLLTMPGNEAQYYSYYLEYFEKELGLEDADFYTKTLFRSRIIGALVIIGDWLKNDKPCSKEELVAIMQF